MLRSGGGSGKETLADIGRSYSVSLIVERCPARLMILGRLGGEN